MASQLNGNGKRLGCALIAAAIAALALPAQGSPPKTPKEWRSDAAEDLIAIHDVLNLCGDVVFAESPTVF